MAFSVGSITRSISKLDSIASGIASGVQGVKSLFDSGRPQNLLDGIDYFVPDDTRDPNRLRPRIQSEDPTARIDAPQDIQILSYPLDRPKYYMSFGFETYRRPSMFEGLKSDGIKDYICLPIPSNLVDSSSFTYTTQNSDNTFDSIQPAVRDAINSWATGSLSTGADLAAQVGGILGKTGDALIGGGIQDILGSVPYSEQVKQTLGLADNPFMSIAFVGPNFKTHGFSWRISPRNEAESIAIEKIVNTFKKIAHPEILSSAVGGFYKYPDVVWAKFNPRELNDKLYRFKPCVITNISVNWAPNNAPGFHTNGTPVEIILSLELQEIELWRSTEAGSAGFHQVDDFTGVADPSPPRLEVIKALDRSIDKALGG